MSTGVWGTLGGIWTGTAFHLDFLLQVQGCRHTAAPWWDLTDTTLNVDH